MSYVPQLEAWLRGRANPEHAEKMSAYMRNQFPFLGLRSPERLETTKAFLAQYGIPSFEELEGIARELWALPEREFQYTSILLLEKKLKQATSDQIELLEQLIITRSWWDTVDIIAGKLVGSLFTRYPELIQPYVWKWVQSDEMWLRRSAILLQLNYKGRTDKELLFECIRRCAHEDEFFIRKAIGWALRQYAKTDKQAIIQFVEETELSPLSKKEALKHTVTAKNND